MLRRFLLIYFTKEAAAVFQLTKRHAYKLKIIFATCFNCVYRMYVFGRFIVSDVSKLTVFFLPLLRKRQIQLGVFPLEVLSSSTSKVADSASEDFPKIQSNNQIQFCNLFSLCQLPDCCILYKQYFTCQKFTHRNIINLFINFFPCVREVIVIIYS